MDVPSPQAVAFSLAIAGSLAVVGRTLFKSTPADIATDPIATVDALPVVPPVANAPIPPPANLIHPAASEDEGQALGNPGGNAPIPNAALALLVPAPVIAAIVATFASALGRLDALLAILTQTPLDVAPLIPFASNTPIRGPRGMANLRINGMSDLALCAMLRRLWTGARRKGSYMRGKNDYTFDNATHLVVIRMRRVMKVINDNTQLWVGRTDIRTAFQDHPILARHHIVPRVGPFAHVGNKFSDVVCEAGGVMSDTIWVHHLFLVVQSLFLRYGASNCQAKYMGACATIDALCVSYGIDPRVGIDGLDPEDMGITVPDNLPQTFTRI